MKKFTVILLFIVPNLMFGQSKYQEDFEELWRLVDENYAYLHQQRINWQKVKTLYQPIADTIKTDNQFVRFLENVLKELHNGHISLNTNLHTSNRLVPSGADLYVEKQGNRYIVTDIRKDFGAEQCGIKIGMEITGFNDKGIGEQLKKFLPTYTTEPTL